MRWINNLSHTSFIWLLLLGQQSLIFSPSSCWGAREYLTVQDQEAAIRQQRIDDLVAACIQGKKKDEICKAIIEFKQIGDDSIEAIKSLYPMGPFEYFVLTVINFAQSGRLRIQPEPMIHAKVRNIIEYRTQGEIKLLISFEF